MNFLKNMSFKKFETFILNLSRFYGLILVASITLFLTIFLIIVGVVHWTSYVYSKTMITIEKMTYPDQPRVQFYLSDFTPPKEVSNLKQEQIRPRKQKNGKFSQYTKLVLKDITPLYEKTLNQYIEKNQENLFPNEETREEDKQNYKNNQLNKFIKFSSPYLKNYLQWRLFRKIDKEYHEELFGWYKQNLMEYIKKAQVNNVEIFTKQEKPIFSIQNSEVIKKFNNFFIEEAREWQEGKKSLKEREKNTTLFPNWITIVIVGGLFSMFTIIILLFATSVSIMRIESKIKG